MLKYGHPVLAWLIHYWPATIFLPAILLLIATLAVVTRQWDRCDAAGPQRSRRRGVNDRRLRQRPA